MEGQLKAPESATLMQMEVAAYVWGFRLSYMIPLQRFNACLLVTDGCPLVKDEIYAIKAGGYPQFPLKNSQRIVEVVLRNENKQIISCGKSKIKFK